MATYIYDIMITGISRDTTDADVQSVIIISVLVKRFYVDKYKDSGADMQLVKFMSSDAFYFYFSSFSKYGDAGNDW